MRMKLIFFNVSNFESEIVVNVFFSQVFYSDHAAKAEIK